MDIKLSFHGAAQNVTGSRYLLEANGSKVFIDCGIFQEWKLKDRNWEPFSIKPQELGAVVLTHAHLDHCGLLPKLVKEGFAGKIHCTAATAEIADIVMQDSGHIQEEDAAYKQKRHEAEGRTGPHPVVPLYTKDDAVEAASHMARADFDSPVEIAPGIEGTFIGVGHILGASSVRLRIEAGGEERTILFSGDVGRWDMPILKDPAPVGRADYVVVESTYGDRLHEPNEEIPERLAAIINETRAAGGNIVIPSFSVERTQDLLYHLSRLRAAGEIPHMVVFVDSPMAIRVTEVFRHHRDLFDEEATEMLLEGKHPCDFPGLQFTRTTDQSKSINSIKGSAIIIAGSGMCTGGRIKHHLINNIGREESTVLFVGYQANGTLGRSILEGTTEVRIHGQPRKVAARIEQIGGFSAHADRNELLRWLGTLEGKPRRVFVTHGEPDAAAAFAEAVRNELNVEARVPEYREQTVLD